MNKYVFDLQRFSDNGESTLSIFFTEKLFESYILEDEFRKDKVKGETRVDAGLYRVKIRKALTGLTKKYRAKYPWFEYHIEIVGFPRHKYVYIHVGNIDDHTDACLLMGETANDNHSKDGFVGSSAVAFKKFYQKYYPIIKDEINNEVWINIMDENKIQYHED